MSDVLSENNSTEASETSFETVSDASPFTVPSDHLESIESSEESSEDLSVLNSFLSSGIDVDYFEGGDVEERPLVLHVHQNYLVDAMRDVELLRKYFIGHCNSKTAENSVLVNADFRFYKKIRSHPDLKDSAQLRMVHRSHDGQYFHYEVMETEIDGTKKFYVSRDGHTAEFFDTIPLMLDFYSRNYVLGQGYVDVFPDPKLDAEAK